VIVGFEGENRFDPSKPDGTPRKLLDVGRLNALGWKSRVTLREGIRTTYDWYVKNRLKGEGSWLKVGSDQTP
jgi:GDP-L-fucose synthase